VHGGLATVRSAAPGRVRGGRGVIQDRAALLPARPGSRSRKSRILPSRGIRLLGGPDPGGTNRAQAPGGRPGDRI